MNYSASTSTLCYETPLIHLRQGEYFVSDFRPAVVCAVLGSCVAVTMYSSELGIGAVNHGFLPCSVRFRNENLRHPGHFVDTSTELLLEEMLRSGADRSRLEVKAFGAASVLCPGYGEEAFRVGSQNEAAVLETLNKLGLKAIRTDLGGERGRKLVFHPHTGDVWVKKLFPNGNSLEVGHD